MYIPYDHARTISVRIDVTRIKTGTLVQLWIGADNKCNRIVDDADAALLCDYLYIMTMRDLRNGLAVDAKAAVMAAAVLVERARPDVRALSERMPYLDHEVTPV